MTLFGPIKSVTALENAVLKTLRTWLPTYLAEVERQEGLTKKALSRVPSEENYHGGLDFEGFNEEELPAVIVVCKPQGETEYAASVGYSQRYRVGVGCVVAGEDGAGLAVLGEDEARLLAGYWGAAVQGLVQQGELGGFAERTRMVGAPDPEFVDERRRLARSVTTFNVWVPQLILEEAGPFGKTPAESAGYGGEPEAPFSEAPEVKTTKETVVGKTPSEEV